VASGAQVWRTAPGCHFLPKPGTKPNLSSCAALQQMNLFTAPLGPTDLQGQRETAMNAFEAQAQKASRAAPGE